MTLVPVPQAWCEKPCEDALLLTRYDLTVEVEKHYHHRCWQCGGEVVSRFTRSYDCRACDCSLGERWPSDLHLWFDPEFAARAVSPDRDCYATRNQRRRAQQVPVVNRVGLTPEGRYGPFCLSDPGKRQQALDRDITPW